MSSSKIGTCVLCKKSNATLEESHIIPKFVFRRIMKNSITNKMRNPYDPNKTLQDGDKEYLLCGDCEDIFNKFETEFSKKIFHPYKEGKLVEFEYNKWMNFFICSVNWRNLYLDIIDTHTNFKEDELGNLKICEEILRDYLLEKRDDIGHIENHIFFFDDIKETNDADFIDSGPHSFLRHSSFGYTFTAKGGHYVVANLLGIIICSILSKSDIEEWKNTHIVNGVGNLKIEKQIVSSPVFGELKEYMIDSRKARQNLSEKQKEKTIERLQKNKDKIFGSEMLKNRMKDQSLKRNF